MERAGKLLAKLKLSDKISGEELARAAWPGAVGKRIAAHAAAGALVRDRLVIEVEDAVWRKQLFHLRHQILAKLQETLGKELVRDLEFRLPIPRRPPRSEPALPRAAGRMDDDAEAIADPVLRGLYKQSRKKATA